MARTRTLPPKQRRREILKAARAALIEKGYADVHLDDVSQRAKVAKGTLYLYFSDKENLFGAALADVIDRLEARLRGLRKEGSSLDFLRRIAEVELDFTHENQDFLVQFSREKPSLCGHSAGKILKDRFQKHLDFLATQVRSCIREGSLRNVDPSLGALLFISLVRMFLLREVMTRSRRPLRQFAPKLMDIFLHGLGKAP